MINYTQHLSLLSPNKRFPLHETKFYLIGVLYHTHEYFIILGLYYGCQQYGKEAKKIPDKNALPSAGY